MLKKAEILAGVLVLAAVSAMADADDPPSRVARLNYLSGSVSFRPGSVEDWTDATLNYPLTTGDHLWADSGAQTEMHIGSTGIRMGSQTAMSILNLDDRVVQLSLTQGALNVRLRSLGDDETFEVDTPNVAVTLLRPGEYRIDTDGDNNVTTVTVRSGDVSVTGGGAAFAVHARQSARIAGADYVTQEMTMAPPPDEFDRWCQMREARLERVESARYVSPEMTGYEDLDQYGVWREDPQYGWIWAPRVEVGWAPYRYGHWAWIDPWGWTWVDDAPWGFAPFHYGRWAYVGAGWVWVPGTRVARPVYAPALVAFVGGPRFSVAVGVGGGGVAAWFPLGPHEVYRPAYHVSEVYVRQVNVTHVTNINVVNVTNVTNIRYVNQTVPGAVTAVPHETFVTARPVARSVVRVDTREVAQAQVVGTAPPIPPRRESVLAGGARSGAPPARVVERTVVAKTPPPPPPVNFRAKQQALEANQGRPLAPQQVNSLRVSAPPPRPMVRTVNPPAPAQVTPGQPSVAGPRGYQPAPQQLPPQRPAEQMRTPAVQPAQRPPAVERPNTEYRPAPQQQPPPPSQQRPVEQRPNTEYRPAPQQTQPEPSPVRRPFEQRQERPPAAEHPAPAPQPPPAVPPSPRHVEQQNQERPAAAEQPKAGPRGGAQQKKQEKKEEKKQ